MLEATVNINLTVLYFFDTKPPPPKKKLALQFLARLTDVLSF